MYKCGTVIGFDINKKEDVTMTKQILVCDRCGTEVEQPVLEVYMRKPSMVAYYNVFFPTSYDLCPKCKDELKKFMKNER